VSEEPIDSLDVPVSRVGRGHGRSVRSWLAIAAVTAIGAAWLGVTVLSAENANGPASADASRRATVGPASNAPPGSPAATAIAASRPPGPDLPVIANVALPGAPFPVFVVRAGQDADMLIWHPGSVDVGQMATFPGAFGGTFGSPPTGSSDTPDGGTFAWLSPDRSSLLVSRALSASAEGSDTATLATFDGIAWERAGITALGGVAWSPDGGRLVIPERQDRWLLVERDTGWTAREIDLSAVAPPAPSRPAGGDFALANQIVPAGFSQSGAWAIGALLGPPNSLWTPNVRVRVADGQVERISSFPIGGPDGLAAGSSLIVDPATGRTVGYGPYGNIPGGRPQLEVREPDGSHAFGARSGIVISWLWTGDGRLVVLGADGYPFPSRWTLQVIERDGTARTLLEAPRASTGAMFGIRDGYAGLILTGANPSRRQVIVVRLDDGAASAVTVDSFGTDGPVGAGWLP
jgi:hypothetical protein